MCERNYELTFRGMNAKLFVMSLLNMKENGEMGFDFLRIEKPNLLTLRAQCDEIERKYLNLAFNLGYSKEEQAHFMEIYKGNELKILSKEELEELEKTAKEELKDDKYYKCLVKCGRLLLSYRKTKYLTLKDWKEKVWGIENNPSYTKYYEDDNEVLVMIKVESKDGVIFKKLIDKCERYNVILKIEERGND